eukprot:gene7195-7962_t
MLPQAELKKGWLKKQARSGLVKNWQTRFFVLHQSRISYYAKEIDRFPFGDELKGDLFLMDAKLERRNNDRQIFIQSANGQKDMLMEANSAEEAQQWITALKQHIAGASKAEGSLGSAKTLSATSDLSLSAAENAEAEAAPGDLASPTAGTGGSGGGETSILPRPGWVIKVFRTTGEKVFINLCEHAEVPNTPLVLSLGYNKWPFMVLSGPRQLVEDPNQPTVALYDAVVHPAVIAHCQKDSQAKDAACARVMRLLRKQYGEDLQTEFKLPKITKRYKGELVAIALPANLQVLSRTRSSVYGAPSSDKLQRTNSSSAAPATNEGDDAARGNNNSLKRKQSINVQQAASSPPSNPPTSFTSEGDYSSQTPSAANNPATPLSSNMAGVKVTRSPLLRSSTTMSAVSPMSGESGFTRRTTISKLFTANDGSEDNSRADLNGRSPGDPGLTRLHSEIPYKVAQDVRAGGSIRAARSSLLHIPGRPTGRDNNQRKLVIPFQVVRSNGTIAKSRPERSAPGHILAHGALVYAIHRKTVTTVDGGGGVWLATTEGWIWISAGNAVSSPNSSILSSPTIVPVLPAQQQPVKIKIATTRFNHPTQDLVAPVGKHGSISLRESESGWFTMRNSASPMRGGAGGGGGSTSRLSLGATFQTRFVMDVFFLDDAFLRLTRTFSEVIILREGLLASQQQRVVKDRVLKAGPLPFEEDGLPLIVDDLNVLLETVEGVENWFNKLLQLQVSLSKCKLLADFFSPRADAGDYDLMENELMAQNGVNGAWADELERDF